MKEGMVVKQIYCTDFDAGTVANVTLDAARDGYTYYIGHVYDEFVSIFFSSEMAPMLTEDEMWKILNED